MLIKSIMTPLRELITIDQNQTIAEAFKLIEQNGFLSIPVTNHKTLAGFISKQFVYDQYFILGAKNWEEFKQKPVSDFLAEKLETVSEDIYVEEAADLFFKNKIRFIPVKNSKGDFVGIITQKSLFGIISHVYGLHDPKIIIILDDMRGSIAKVTDIISKNGGDIKNIVNFDTEVMGLQELTIRLTTDDGKLDRIVERLKENGFKVKDVVFQTQRQPV